MQREGLQVGDEVMAKVPWALGGQGSLSGVRRGQEYVARLCVKRVLLLLSGRASKRWSSRRSAGALLPVAPAVLGEDSVAHPGP